LCARGVQRLGDLACGEAEHVAQDQHSALPSRKVLKRSDERKLDALTLLVARHRRRKRVLGVGIRLDPDRLAQPGGELVMRVSRRTVVHRKHALGAPFNRAQASVCGNPVQPRAQ